jgi:ArsR family transcriptional regulator, cadmium/lead-responsive transcriptional repressor
MTHQHSLMRQEGITLSQQRSPRLSLAAQLFRGLSDANRLGILDALRDGPRTVSEVVATLGLTQSNVSNHLGCLRDCGLVKATPDGRFVRYELADPRIDGLLSMADEILGEVADGVGSCGRYRNETRDSSLTTSAT